jgi:Tfp pilus assembly protein PilW
LNRVLSFVVDRYGNTEISRTHVTETAGVVRLTCRYAAVYTDTCSLTVDVAGASVRDGSFNDNVYRQRFNNDRLIIAEMVTTLALCAIAALALVKSNTAAKNEINFFIGELLFC